MDLTITRHRPHEAERAGLVGEFVAKIGREERGALPQAVKHRGETIPLGLQRTLIPNSVTVACFSAAWTCWLWARRIAKPSSTMSSLCIKSQSLKPNFPLIRMSTAVTGECCVKLLGADQL